jgi:imidazolonepropionase-like amidohydrolase
MNLGRSMVLSVHNELDFAMLTRSSPTKIVGTVLFGQVIDGTLNPPIADGAVVFKGERIVWVGERARLPEEYKQDTYDIVGMPGRSILPGLIDGHTHISFGEARSEEELALYTSVEYRAIKAIWNARKVLQAGITSAFDPATTFDIAQNVLPHRCSIP